MITSSGDTYLLFDQFSPDLFTGCPFRHTDADLLRQRLAAYRIPKKGIDEVQLKALTEKGVSFLIQASLCNCINCDDHNFFIMFFSNTVAMYLSRVLHCELLLCNTPDCTVQYWSPLCLQIMEFVKESHYQLACTRYFELTHGVWTLSPF